MELVRRRGCRLLERAEQQPDPLSEELELTRERAALVLESEDRRRSERMNRTMYRFGIITCIFLPMSFVTGLLGINVGAFRAPRARMASCSPAPWCWGWRRGNGGCSDGYAGYDGLSGRGMHEAF